MRIKKRTLRIATLAAQPTLLAFAVDPKGDRPWLLVAASVLVGLWVVLAGAIALRVIEARRAPGRENGAGIAQIDVLTPLGTATLWLGMFALLGAARIGWASLSVVGVLGIGSVYLATMYVVIRAGGLEPWRRATIERAILPALATEGSPLREEVRVKDVKIPMGLRMFAIGRATPHAPVTHYALESDASMADIKVASQLGAAQRGDHQAPPLALWLGDVLGMARTAVVHRGECAFSVMPYMAIVDGAKALMGKGGDDQRTAPEKLLPTEGTFRMREYAPGDDTRRIHWVRSVNANKLIVRLPDEVPEAEPAVRIVLDSELHGADALGTRAPDDLLDALVRVWLGIGKALADGGMRVTLAVAVDGKLVEKRLVARSRDALKLGARVRWQTALATGAVVGGVAKRGGAAHHQIVISARPRALEAKVASEQVTWVVVPERAWTSPDPRMPAAAPVVLPFPMGSADNRGDRRRRERRRIAAMHAERAFFRSTMVAIDWRAAQGGFIARPGAAGHIGLAVIP